MTLRIFYARAVHTLSDGSEQQVFEGELPAHHLCQAVSWFHDRLKREGIATSREILDGTVRIVAIHEETDSDAQVTFSEGIKEGMAHTMERTIGQ